MKHSSRDKNLRLLINIEFHKRPASPGVHTRGPVSLGLMERVP